MDRRGFLGVLAAAIPGATYDPDRALWVAGRKLISIPRPRVTLGDLVGELPARFLAQWAVFRNAGRVPVLLLKSAEAYGHGGLPAGLLNPGCGFAVRRGAWHSWKLPDDPSALGMVFESTYPHFQRALEAELLRSRSRGLSHASLAFSMNDPPPVTLGLK